MATEEQHPIGEPAAPAASPSQPERPDVFVSYSRHDGDFVRELVRALEARGRDVWVDLEDIPKSADWRRKIESGIESAKAVVAVLSPSFAGSQICGEEIRQAIRHNKRLIPILHRDVDADQLVPELDAPNWIVARDAGELAGAVDELLGALDTDLDWIDLHARLVVRSAEWDRENRDSSFLLRGKDLQAAERWLAARGAHREQPTDLQVAYIEAGRDAARRRRGVAIAAGAVAIAVPVLGGIALLQGHKATEQASLAQSRQLAAAATARLASDPTRALGLALQAERRAPTPEALGAMRLALMHPRPDSVLRVGGNAIKSASFVDPRHVVGQSFDGTVRRWDVDGGPPMIIRRHAPPTRPVRASRAAGLVARASREGVRIVDAAGATILRLRGLGRGLEGAPPAASLSSDGRRVVTAGYGKAATIWRIPVRVIRPPGAAHAICAVAAGRYIATCDDRGRIAVWRPGSRRPLHLVTVGPGDAHPRDFDLTALAARDGRRIFVSSRRRGTTAVVDARSGRVLAAYRGSFLDPPTPSPDGRRLYVGGAHGARIEDARTRRALVRLPLGDFADPSVAFDARADRIVTSHRQQAFVRVWDARTGRRVALLRPFGAPVDAVAISPSGRYVATAAGEVARVWEVASARPVATLPGHGRFVLDAQFSADGAFVVTAADDGAARVWEARTGRPVATFTGHRGGLLAASFGPGSRSVITVGFDGTVLVHDCPACAPASVAERRARAALRGR